MTARADSPAEVERRLARTARFLASDELEGRGLGTPGIRRAGDFIADQFREIGLTTDVFDGQPHQRFEITLGAELGDNITCQLRGPSGENSQLATIALEVGEDFNPLAIGGDGLFDLPLVFAGYGITAPEFDYDDYANLDVAGKAVIVMRHEPQQANPHSVFAGNENSEHAPFRRKISNAFQQGAAAVIFCNDLVEIENRVAQWEKRIAAAKEELASTVDDDDQPKLAAKLQELTTQLADERDPVLAFSMAGEGGEAREIPVLHMRRGVIDQLLAAAGRSPLADLEHEIDESLTPQSFELTDWRVAGHVAIERQQVEVRNVVAVLEGHGPLADETVVVGAHFDHLGRGGEGSAAPGSQEIHNGADDNASGIAVLLEVARQLAERSEPLARRVVFAAFTGEERGLLGSAEYARTPPFPLEQTVAMLNFDMVGRLTDNKFIIFGTGTAAEFDGWIDTINERHGFEITRDESGFGPSDHSTFYAKQIPVLHFFTGSHTDYHRPSDDFQLLNVEGMRRVSEFTAQMVAHVADAPERVAYVEIAQTPIGDGRANPRPYFGSIPDFANNSGGYAISGTGPGSPAADAGMQPGDVIIQLGEFKVGNLEDFDGALRKHEAGDRVPVVVRRGEEEVTLEVTLDPPR
jgi:hypothetical protein